MSTNYDAGSEQQYYGGTAYGSGYERPFESTCTPSGGVVARTVFRSISGTIGSSSTVGTLEVTAKITITGGITPTSAAIGRKVNKYLAGSMTPRTNDTNVLMGFPFFPDGVDDTEAPVTKVLDGLIKRTFVSKTSSITPTGSVGRLKRYFKSISGGITPTGAPATLKRTLSKQTITGSMTPTGAVESSIQDPNDIEVLVRKNAQKVVPRVKAYWSSGRFTTNLIGYSSSDSYQAKTETLNPLVYLKFDELSQPAQTVALDTSVNNYDGKYVGTIAGITGALHGPDVGKYAMSVDGGGYVQIPSNDNLNPVNNFQVECWLRVTGTPAAEMYAFSKGSGTANADKQFGMSIDTNKRINVYAYSGSTQYTVQGTTAMTNNVWYHAVLSVENQKLKLLVNGVQEGSTTNIGADVNTGTGALEIGRLSTFGSYFVGGIDEFAMYDSVRFSGSGSAYARYRSGINVGTNTLGDKFYPEQLMNGYARVSYVWGVTDTKKLNGEYITANGESYAMEEEDSFRYEHGWWSRSISDSDGKMNFVETVVCEFDPHPATQIDVFGSEFFAGMKEFDIYYKNDSDVWTLLVAGVIIPQDDFLSTINLGGSLVYIKGIRIDVKSIWAGEDVARIEEVDPTYVTDISDDVVSFTLDTEREHFDSNIPIGSASANGMTLTLDNTDLKYSAYNPSSPYYGLVLPDVKFEVELGWYGTSYNYEPLGTLWADEWQEDSGNMTVDVTCRDYAKFLQEITTVGNIWLDIDGPDAIANLLKEANFPLFDIDVDLPYDTTSLRTGAAGLWMMHEATNKRYAVSWTEYPTNITTFVTPQYAMGDIQHGPSGSFTYMFWINTTPYPNEQVIAHFYNTSSDYIMIANPKGITVDISGSKVFTGVNVAQGVWNQVSISWNSSNGQLKVYVNSVLKSTMTVGVGKVLTGSYSLSLGIEQRSKRKIFSQGQDGVSSTYRQFIGQQAHILLWNGVLSNDDINDRAFRDVLALEKDMLLSFTGFEGGFDVAEESRVLMSRAYGQDILKMVNVEFVEAGFMQIKDSAHRSNLIDFGNIDMHQQDSAFSLEPYNRSVLLNGEKPDYLSFDGASSPYIQTPASTRVSVTGDIEVYLQVALPTFTPSAAQELYTQSKPSTNQRSLSISLQTSGALRLSYSTAGTSFTNVTSTVPLQSKDLRPFEKFWIKVVHDVNNGAAGNDVYFYVSKEDMHPAQILSWDLVQKVTTGTAITRFGSTAPVVLGADSDNGNKFKGNIYAVYMVSGIATGDDRIDLNDDQYLNRSMTTITDATQNIWTRNATILSHGIGSYFLIPQSTELDVLSGSFSLAFWAKPKANETYVVMTKENIGSSTLRTMSVIFTNDGRVGLVSKNGSLFYAANYQDYGTSVLTKHNVISTSKWNFIGISYNATTKDVIIYVNGAVVGKGNMSVGFNSNTNAWLVGTDGNLAYFTGTGLYMNGFAIYDAALSEAKFKTLYRAGASLANHRFPVVWTEEGESIWDAMLAVSTGDLGIFYFNENNRFIYSNALNNYSDAYEEFAIPQWYFDDDIDIVSGSQSIALQSNKVVVKILPTQVDFNKREQLWTAPDNASIVGGELAFDISQTFSDYLIYKTKIIGGGTGVVPIRVPDFLPTGYIKIDDEIIRYESKDEERLYGLTRGAFDTEPTSHSADARVREVRVFNVEYSSKPAIVLDDPFITAVNFDGTVDIDSWRPEAFGGELVISRNNSGDPYLVQMLQNTDPMSNLHNFLVVSGIAFANVSSGEKEEFESAEYTNNIRRHGIKPIDVSNRFIGDHNTAKKYADYFLRHFSSPVPIIEVAIMGNPLIKLGDRVRIVSFDRMAISHQDFWIESISIDYNGGISQNLTLRKVA